MSRRAWVALAVGLALAVAAAVWAGRGGERTARLDPDNPGRDGARAVARVLADQGVEVDVVRSAAAFGRASLDDATVVVTSTSSLTGSVADRLTARTRGRHPVVLVDPSGPVTASVGAAGGPVTHAAVDGLPAACGEPALTGLTLRTDRVLAYPDAGAASCFPTGDGAAYVRRGDGLVLLGAGDALTNGQVLRADNAAVALRLLGARDRVVWYVPDPADLAAGDEVGLAALLPRWLLPALWLGGLVLGAVLLWRGRRLGPLVAEPLPVTVRAVESTLARGRLYRRSGDRAHAARMLRRAARQRWRERLRLPADTADAVLDVAVARATGRDPGAVAAVLDDAATPPATDRDLVRLAADLAREPPPATTGRPLPTSRTGAPTDTPTDAPTDTLAGRQP